MISQLNFCQNETLSKKKVETFFLFFSRMSNVFFCLSNDSPSFQPRPLGQLQGTRAPLGRAPVIPTIQAVMDWKGMKHIGRDHGG